MNTDDGYITDDGRKIGGVVMEMKNITLRFGGVTAIKDITFDIREGEIRAIIGPNGAGFSCAIWSDNSPNLTLSNIERYVLDRSYSSKPKGNIFHLHNDTTDFTAVFCYVSIVSIQNTPLTEQLYLQHCLSLHL